MSDYTKTTNFTAKDSLPSGNPAKLVSGVDFDLEFGAIATAIGTKADQTSIANILETTDLGVTVQAYDADTAKLDVAQAWTASQSGATDTSSITGSTTLDFSLYQNFVLTLTGSVTLDNPTTETTGQSGFIVMIQDGTGSRTVALGSQYKTAGGAGLTLSTVASSIDVVPYIVSADGSILLGNPQLAFG